MAADIKLSIYMPEKRVLNQYVYRIVLPCQNKTLTVIKDRAPTLLPLDMGALQILNEDGAICEEYLIAGGLADIKQNTCTILTESIFNRKDLNLEKVRELYKEFKNPFYQWLVQLFESGK
ncbi:MAG: hypothetical protein IJ864_01070 [Alphaproteobacteria bacterium]|nr:hypothetical protein [Alphaproteobacteria bacterium]